VATQMDTVLNSKVTRKLISYLLSLLVMLSCRQVSNKHNTNSEIRDSAMRSYLTHTDNLFKDEIEFYDLDSNEYNYKMLKAYYLNDTTYLKRVIKNIENPENKNTSLDSFWKTNIPILKNLNIEEGYQFQYSETFCNDYYIITISQMKDSIKINTFIYRPTSVYNVKPIKLEVVKKSNKLLSVKNWNELLDAIYLADYWNLKPRNDNEVLDPSFLTVVGIKRDIQNNKIDKTNSVTRTVFRKTALYQAFLLSLKFAEIEKVCKQ
jgi:hypothetical protein